MIAQDKEFIVKLLNIQYIERWVLNRDSKKYMEEIKESG